MTFIGDWMTKKRQEDKASQIWERLLGRKLKFIKKRYNLLVLQL
jgi:hypothetical protein